MKEKLKGNTGRFGRFLLDLFNPVSRMIRGEEFKTLKQASKVLEIFTLCGLMFFLLSIPGYSAGLSLPDDDNENTSAFSVVLLPDTQYYSQKAPEVYYNQTQWIVDHQDEYNIQFVIHLGDITNHNTKPQWKVADKAHKTLDDAGIHYSIVPGNHDIISGDYPRNYSNFRKYFPASRFGGHSWIENCDSCAENNYTIFEYDNLQFLVISLEMTPSKDAICWANQVINQYPYHRVIVVTHCYQVQSGKYSSPCDTYYNLIGANGSELWDEFISRHSNIFMILSGHINGSIHTPRDGVHGNTVHQILTDFQFENYGDGWLRILTFSPGINNGVVSSEVLSTEGFTELSVRGPKGDYPVIPNHQQHAFRFEYDMVNAPSQDQFDNSEFVFYDRIVNIESNGEQYKPAVAMDSNGNFVVAWEDDQDENGHYQIYARGFYPGGCSRFFITVNSTGKGQQLKPAVAMNSNGDFVVAWEDDQDGNGNYQIFVRGFNADGSERFHDKVVNSAGKGQQLKPAVAIDSDGNFVVAWEDDQDGNGYCQIFVRGFNADGTERFHDKVVNSAGKGQQLKPAVAMDSNGNFVVAWEDDQDGNGYCQIFVRGFKADGTERFHDKVVNSAGKGQQLKPAVAMDSNGNFVVAWEDDRDGNKMYQIYVRGFKANGTERFHDKVVNSAPRGQQLKPAAAMAANGNFVVAWEDDLDEKGGYQIYARGFDYTGSELFHDIKVNRESDKHQIKPGVAINSNGEIIFVWEDYIHKEKKHSSEILARGFSFDLYL